MNTKVRDDFCVKITEENIVEFKKWWKLQGYKMDLAWSIGAYYGINYNEKYHSLDRGE